MSQPIKARVIVAFTDKNDMSSVYQIGDTFESTQARVNELVTGGYVEQLDKQRKRQPKEQ